MGTEPVPETYLNQLMQLIAREDYTESCRRESFKTYVTKYALDMSFLYMRQPAIEIRNYNTEEAVIFKTEL
jgi:phosphatidylserine decarboxylase